MKNVPILIWPWTIITKQSDTIVMFQKIFCIEIYAAANFTGTLFGSGLVPCITKSILSN